MDVCSSGLHTLLHLARATVIIFPFCSSTGGFTYRFFVFLRVSRDLLFNRTIRVEFFFHIFTEDPLIRYFDGHEFIAPYRPIIATVRNGR